MVQSVKKNNRMQFIKKELFILSIIILPVACFIVFYVIVNLNMFTLAFQKYNIYTDKLSFVGFENFRKFFFDVFHEKIMITSIKNSSILLIVRLVVSMPISIVVSFSIWNKMKFAGIFKVVLFLPSIISGMVFVCIAKYFIGSVLPIVFNNSELSRALQTDAQFNTILIYDTILGFAGNMVLYLGAMSTVDNSVVEYSEIDGCNSFKKMIHVVLPSIFPTISTFLIVSITYFFVGYGSIFSFAGIDAMESSYTLGYYFFRMVYTANSYVEYPYASAASLFFTLIAFPVTLLVKTFLQKIGPTED